MNKTTYFFLFLLLIISGCKSSSVSDSPSSNQHPNSIQGLAATFKKVNACTFESDHGEVTVGGFYISKKPVSVNSYFAFIQDISKNIKSATLKDSLLLYFDVDHSPIRLHHLKLEIDTKYSNSPMTYVSYFGAEAYCYWLTQKYCVPRGVPRFRLPSDYEWLAALQQHQIKSSKKGNYRDWMCESYCIESYQPLVKSPCVPDWFSPYPPPQPDSVVVNLIVKKGEYASLGVHKAKMDSTIGFRIVQTYISKSFDYEF